MINNYTSLAERGNLSVFYQGTKEGIRMIENFFASYKNFIVVPVDEKLVVNEVYDPKNYAAYDILTLSIFDSRFSIWKDVSKFEIDVEKSIQTVLRNFNQMQREMYHLQLLELDKLKNYFILALSSKIKFNPGEEKERITNIVDKILTNPFYVGQGWFNLNQIKKKNMKTSVN